MRTIRKHNKSVSFPISAHDVKVETYVEFTKLIENQILALKNETVTDYTDEIETYITAVGLICKGDLHDLPFDIVNDTTVGVEGFQIARNAKFEDISILRLFVHCQNIILNYIPSFEDNYFMFNWKGETFYLSGSIGKKMSDKNLTTGETIEILEFERLKKTETQKEGDADGAIYFTTLLWRFAVMMRKEGEQLPVNKSERQKFLEERIIFFKDLPMSIVLDLSFFLTRLSVPLLKIPTI